MSTDNENSSNPSERSSKLILQIPAEIKIKLVDASDLNSFKLWSVISSIMTNVVVGFWVWYGQNTNPAIESYLKATTWILTLLCLVSYCICIWQNKKMNKKSMEVIYSPNS